MGGRLCDSFAKLALVRYFVVINVRFDFVLCGRMEAWLAYVRWYIR